MFNALKLNATLALIGAIVAEFFGTPIVGMGFRISTEAAQLDLDVVWAEIVDGRGGSAAISFALRRLLERAVTFWHPSFRAETEQDRRRGQEGGDDEETLAGGVSRWLSAGRRRHRRPTR